MNELVERALRAVRIEELMTHLARLTEHDRYQASLGIERAAELIAEAARAIGLSDVTIEWFTADGTTQWWTFDAPRAWTPTTARLEIPGAGIVLDHATQPFTIATYSAPTPAEGLVARVVAVRGDPSAADLAGAVAVLDATSFARPDMLALLAARGAAGFITDATCRGATGEHVGRIELDMRTPLFGFSVTSVQRQAIEAALGRADAQAAENGRSPGGDGAHVAIGRAASSTTGDVAPRVGAHVAIGRAASSTTGDVAPRVEARVRVDIDRSARMPVVIGVLPGRDASEVWLTSHLCHPRPGANDNASGAAAQLGVARALVDRRSETGRDFERTIRFVWGPEFLGVAALLHDRFTRLGREARPVAVINLDMVGEDPAQCGVPLVVERAPEWCASMVTPVAEHVVEQVFEQTRAHVGTWRAGPFLGFSDHALFANVVDPTWRSPAVQLWHPGDPFNHSAADTLDKVSPIQMQRATAVGAVLAEIFASTACDGLESIVERWCAREEHAANDIAERFRAIEQGAWSRRLVEHVSEQNAIMRSLAADGPTAHRTPVRDDLRRAFIGRWRGPFNYRAVLAGLGPARRAEVVALFAADKRNYAVLTHLAMLANGGKSLDAVADAASLALRAPIDKAAAGVLWSALFDAGWIEETSDGR